MVPLDPARSAMNPGGQDPAVRLDSGGVSPVVVPAEVRGELAAHAEAPVKLAGQGPGRGDNNRHGEDRRGRHDAKGTRPTQASAAVPAHVRFLSPCPITSGRRVDGHVGAADGPPAGIRPRSACSQSGQLA
jgi:hypothetical protein